MLACPSCGAAMKVTEVHSVAGIRDKPVRWRCQHDGVLALPVHPVQIVHLRPGRGWSEAGARGRILKLEMVGAELLAFVEPLAPEQLPRSA